jgi:hypothetical protein
MKSGGRAFERFEAIGDSHLGVYQFTEKQEKTFPDGKKTITVHVFWRPANPAKPEKKEGDFEITGAYHLDKCIEKAKKDLGLQERAGHLVKSTWVSNRDTGQASPMKVFDVQVDTDYPSNPKAKLPPNLKTGGTNQLPPDDDIPF